jgi:hypothetical protein
MMWMDVHTWQWVCIGRVCALVYNGGVYVVVLVWYIHLHPLGSSDFVPGKSSSSSIFLEFFFVCLFGYTEV